MTKTHAVIISVIIVVAVVAGTFAFMSTTPAPTNMTSATVPTTVSVPQTISIDDIQWPSGDMNELYCAIGSCYPDWGEVAVYQPFISVNPAAEEQGKLDFLPGLAQSWTVSTNGLVWTFNVRRGVTFSNGDPLNAYQIWMQMYSVYYLSGNSSTWINPTPIFDMSTATFGPSTIALINETGLINPSQQALTIMENQSWPIYTIGPYTIVFHLSTPFRWLLGSLVGFAGLIFDSQFVLGHGGFGTPASLNSYFNLNPIPGTGPYIVSNIVENNYVEFTQSQNYWAKNWTASQIAANPLFDPGHVKNVIIYNKPDDTSRYIDLSTGQTQISTILAADWNKIIQSPQQYGYTNTPYGFGYAALAMNTMLYPTNITDVRLAIVHAINYTDVYQEAFHGLITPFVGPEFPGWAEFYNPGNLTPYSYNLSLARQYISEAGLSGTPTLSFIVASGCSFCSSTAEIIQADLAQINLKVSITVEPAAQVYSLALSSYSYLAANYQQVPNLEMECGTYCTPGALNPSSGWAQDTTNGSLSSNDAIYSSPIVVQCANAIAVDPNSSATTATCQQAQLQIYKDAPYAWIGMLHLWWGDGSLVWNKKVISGFYLDPLWNSLMSTALINTITFTNSPEEST